MFQIVLTGIILALMVNTPLIVYLVWSWRLLKRHSEGEAGEQQIWLHRAEVLSRLLVGSTMASVVWSLAAGVFSFFATFLFFAANGSNSDADHAALAQFFFGIAYLPYTIASWVAQFFPNAVGASLLWILLASFIILFMAISILEWLFIVVKARYMHFNAQTR